MKVEAHLRDTRDGRTCVYLDPWRDTFPDGTPVEPHNVIFQWLEGNWSCDCNRICFLESTIDIESWRQRYTDPDSHPCSGALDNVIALDKLIFNGEELDIS